MHPLLQTRRHFFKKSATGIGIAALSSLLNGEDQKEVHPKLPGLPHFAAKAKNVILLFQHGAPSQLDLFDWKPGLQARRGENLPDSIRRGQRLTGMSAFQESFPTAPTVFKFAQHGQSRAWFSELVPHMAKQADDLCFIKSLNTEAINHDPAVTFCQTGFQLAGRPSFGAWVSYGLGSENQNLPAYVVMVSQGGGNTQALADRAFGSGFLPTKYSGVKFRGGADPVLYLSDPDGYSRDARRRYLDDLAKLNEIQLENYQDPEIATRISQYEMAFRMQSSVPELSDLSKEPESTFELYGPDARKPGSYAANCILARRLVERGVRFVQLFHRGWDQHSNLPKEIRGQCKETDQPSAALVEDLKQRATLLHSLGVDHSKLTFKFQGRHYRLTDVKGHVVKPLLS
ncbi:MAG: DUF1501 domain-containing protein [Acidobacteria bacterium]|nr:DUF1501 domain-containing protein [Acidobacteriota bacterium]